MKKNNIIILAIAVLCLLILTCIWAFNFISVDPILDLILAIIWLIIIIISAVILKKTAPDDEEEDEQEV